MGSLQKVVPDVIVKKVEQTEDRNSLFVKSETLTWDQILQAEKLANSVIAEGRNIMEHFFPNLEEARKKFSKMRAMEDRISGEVRVIEIDGYDYAACARNHVSNSKECELFLVTNFSKAEGGAYEIRFEVGQKAKIAALEHSSLLMKVATTLGASIPTLEKTALNLKTEVEALNRKIRELTEKEASAINSEEVNGARLYSKIFDGLETKILMDKAGKLIKNARSIVIFANKADRGFIILARSSDLKFNSSEILRNILASFGGKGGGKEDFASGSVEPSKLEAALLALKERLKSSL
jgi:alanyl-tRNA synthetase